MKKPVTFSSSFRVKAVLCCSVAVLLTACGGTTDEFANQQLLADTVITDPTEASRARTTGAIDAGPATPESIAQDTPMPGAAAQAADSAAPAILKPAPASMDNGVANAAPAARTVEGNAPASNEFNLNGYQQAASSSDPAMQGAPTAAGAEGQ